MPSITCGRCRHKLPLGARVCEICGNKLSDTVIQRACGRNPWYWLQATAVGQMAPFFFVFILLIIGISLHPSVMAIRQGLLAFGLTGILALGVTFPLMKGHYDFSAGSLAGLAACTAALVSPYGWGLSIGAAFGVGLIGGALNGYLAGRTRLSSTIITIMTGTMALEAVLYATNNLDLQMKAPEIEAIGETVVAGIPVILGLFGVALLVAWLLLNQEVFAPVGKAPTRYEATIRSSAWNVFLAFLVSGFMSGLAGLLIASAPLGFWTSMKQTIWLLTPLTAALIGGGSVTIGLGNLRTATIGAAVVTLVNWIVTQLQMPIAGPIVEAPLLAVGLFADRWQNMTLYMIAQARGGNLLVLPEELQLPMLVSVWRETPLTSRLASGMGMLAACTGLYLYFTYYAVEHVAETTALITAVSGNVQVASHNWSGFRPATEGEKLLPGDLIVTGRSSEAIIRFHDGSEVHLFSNSELVIRDLQVLESGEFATTLRMTIGAMFANIQKRFFRKTSFTVQTPFLTLAVRGTSFSLEVQAEKATVAVLEGAVSIKRLVPVEEAFGLIRWFEEERMIEEGMRFEAAARLASKMAARPMSSQEQKQMKTTKQVLNKKSWQQRLRHLRLHIPRSVWFMLVIGYFIFLILVRPAPPTYIGDRIAQRAEALTTRRQRTAADSPRSAALAQMYARAGRWDEALAELQSIIEHDPNSAYGEWAQRFLVEVQRQRERRQKK